VVDVKGDATRAAEPTIDDTQAAAPLEVTRTRMGPLPVGAGELATRVRDASLGPEGPVHEELARGESIGRYVVLDRLGAGAMGVVYCAFDPELDRKVAIKLLKPEAGGGSVSASQDARARLLREAQALAKLNHPNVVGVHDVGMRGDDVWIAMEFVKGQTLTRWRARHRGGWREVLGVMRRAGQGLAAAHAVGLVHRDVKPDNVMVGDDGRVRMMDFGLARRGADPAADEHDTGDVGRHERAMLAVEVTQIGTMIGTPAYMAPEQLMGRRVGAPADVFGFCVMLWEGLHGSRPFGGQTIAELRTNIIAERWLAPAHKSGAPRWLLRVLARGLACDPERRWQHMGELLAELDRGQARRRRWQGMTMIGGLLAAVGGGFGVHELSRRQTIAACEAEGAAILADWNDATRADLERAFLATGKPNAATTLEKTSPWLERWASEWQTTRADECVHHRLAADGDDELHARAVDCLDEARGTFTALLRSFADADAITIVRATTAAAGLMAPGRCREPALLRSRPLLTPEHAGAVKELRARFARVGSLRSAGKFSDGLALAQEALRGAREVAWPAVEAEAEYRVGALQSDQGDYAGAEASLVRALARARDARAPRLALDSMIQLVWVVGDRGARVAEGKVWAESAQTQLTLQLDDDRLAQAQLDNNLGLVHHFAGGHDEAARLHARALAGWSAVLGEQHPQVAQSLNNLANARGHQGAHDEAIALHTRALAIREAALGADHPYVAASLSNLAIEALALKRTDEALRLQLRALAIREAALAPEHPDLIESLNNVATVYYSMRSADEALHYYGRALAILERTPGSNARMMATILYNCALIDHNQGRYIEAARNHERSLAGFEGLLGKDHPNLVYPLEGLADTRVKLGEYDEALRLRLRALAIREAARGKDHPEVATALIELAAIQRKRGAPGEALALDTRAQAIFAAAGEDGAHHE
jgi:tetratricopeptide (TPR) repeat protein